jgi:hypothetical protein
LRHRVHSRWHVWLRVEIIKLLFLIFVLLMLRLANRLLLLLLLLLLPNGGGGGGGGGGDWMANNMFLQRSLGKKSAVGGLFEAQQLGCAEDTLLSVLNRCLSRH